MKSKSGLLTSARVKLHDVLAVGVRGVEVDVAGARLVHQLAGVAARRPALPPVPRGRAAGRTEIMACNRRGREKRLIFMYACRYYKQATEHCLRLLPGPSSVQASDLSIVLFNEDKNFQRGAIEGFRAVSIIE